jgi:D-sedoheptulose 7-phosphate isomerase
MSFYQQYTAQLNSQLNTLDYDAVDQLVAELLACRQRGNKVFLCGNGGSAANAMHIANDLLYGVNPCGRAIDVEALNANSAVMSCLANDTGYDNVFAQQLISKAKAGDVLIVLSGSGNSANIVNALVQATRQGVKTAAVVGFSGGQAKQIADLVIHSAIDDMQIAEDIQLIIGHWLMRALNGALCDA